jgi:hypothetical protein
MDEDKPKRKRKRKQKETSGERKPNWKEYIATVEDVYNRKKWLSLQREIVADNGRGLLFLKKVRILVSILQPFPVSNSVWTKFEAP